MLPNDHENRVVLDEEKIKEWLGKGALPTDRVARMLGDAGLIEKPVYRETPKKSQPKAKAQERARERAEKEAERAAAAAEAAEA